MYFSRIIRVQSEQDLWRVDWIRARGVVFFFEIRGWHVAFYRLLFASDIQIRVSPPKILQLLHQRCYTRLMRVRLLYLNGCFVARLISIELLLSLIIIAICLFNYGVTVSQWVLLLLDHFQSFAGYKHYTLYYLFWSALCQLFCLPPLLSLSNL